MKVIDCYWFTNIFYEQCMGIVKAYDSIEKINKFYIGFGAGKNEDEDIKQIIEHGTKYTEENFKEIFEKLIKAKYNNF